MYCDEAQELLTALIDGELTASERRAIEEHLAGCSPCKLQLEREAALKQSLKEASAARTTPPSLRQAISEKVGAFAPGETRRRRWIGDREWLRLPSLRPIVVVASVIVVLAVALYRLQSQDGGVTADALALYGDVTGGRAIVRVNDAARLKADLSRAVQNRFAPVSPDLSALKVYPVAGFADKIGGRDVLVTVYEGAGPMVICFTFLGDDSDAPKDAAGLFDPERQVNFYSFSRGAVSAVMHRVGEVNCLLVANMPAGELLEAARGKSHHA